MRIIDRRGALPYLPVIVLNWRSRDVKRLQQDLESRPADHFLTNDGKASVLTITQERLKLAASYQENGRHRDAALELRFTAYCLEISVIRPYLYEKITAFTHEQLRTLNQAIQHRFSAIREFRLEAGRYTMDRCAHNELALEISFLAKTLTFARDHLPALKSRKALELLIELRLEAAGIFQRLENHTSAFFEYRHLALLCHTLGDERAADFARRAFEQKDDHGANVSSSQASSLYAIRYIWLHPVGNPPAPSSSST